MTTFRCFLTGFFLLLIIAAGSALPQGPQRDDQGQLPITYVPTGDKMYREFCASCHGPTGKGDGPAAASLKNKLPDLTTLTKRHFGKFPADYVEGVLRSGPGTKGHGSPTMPVWGPIFQNKDLYYEPAVRQRIKNLCDYLESIQVK